MSETALRNLYADQWLSVDTVQAHRGDGSPYPHRTVTVRSGLGAVVVPVVRFRGLMYLAMVSQFRPAIGRMSSEFPRGGTDDLGWSEALREFAEETGLDVPKNVTPLDLGVLHADTGILTTTVKVFAVRHTVDSLPEPRVEHESGAVTEWLPVGVAEGRILSGDVTCGMTMAAFAKASAAGVFQGW